MLIKNENKANCHIHLTGSLNPVDLRRIASVSGIDLVSFEPLENKTLFYNPDIWAAAKESTSTKLGLEEAIKIILLREFNDHVSHLELTVNPTGMIRRGLNISEFVSALQSALEYATSIGVTLKIKLGVNRKDGKESTHIVKKIFDQSPKNIVVAIDLNGDERQFPTIAFEESFLGLNREGIPTTVHAGEHFGLEDSLLSAIRMKPTRIAHSLIGARDDSILEKLKIEGIVLEISPLSGLFTGAVSDFKEYPINRFLDYEIPLVFGSDDPAIFKKDLSDHLNSLQECGLKISEIVELNKKSFGFLF